MLELHETVLDMKASLRRRSKRRRKKKPVEPTFAMDTLKEVDLNEVGGQGRTEVFPVDQQPSTFTAFVV